MIVERKEILLVILGPDNRPIGTNRQSYRKILKPVLQLRAHILNIHSRDLHVDENNENTAVTAVKPR